MKTFIYQYIQTIAQEGSLSKAAAKLYLSQPYLSKLLKQVEEEYDIVIFNRTKRPMELTDAGRRFMRYIDDLSRLESELRLDLSLIRSPQKRVLRLGINANRYKKLAPHILPVMYRRYPNMEILPYERRYEDILTALQRGDVDLGIVSFFEQLPKNLSYEFLGSENILLVLPPDHSLGTPEARGSSTDPPPFPRDKMEFLSKDTCITISPSLGLGQYLYQNVPFIRAQDESKFFYTTSIETAYELMLHGMGYAIVTASFIAESESNRDVYFYTIGTPPLQWTQIIAYSKGLEITDEIRFFINMIKKEFCDTASG